MVHNMLNVGCGTWRQFDVLKLYFTEMSGVDGDLGFIEDCLAKK